MKRRKRAKGVGTKPPRNLKEAESLLVRIGGRQRRLVQIENEINEAVGRLVAAATKKIEAHREAVDEMAMALFVFAESERTTLTRNGKRKSVRVSGGEFGWRMSPLAVSLRESAKVILQRLEQMGLGEFIRVKREVNRQAMAQEPEKARSVKGVAVSQHEEFFIKPRKVEVITANAERIRSKLR